MATGLQRLKLKIKCPECRRGFTDLANLRRHMTQTGCKKSGGGQRKCIVVQHHFASGWQDMTDGTNHYYHGENGKPFASVDEAILWILEYHDPKHYPARFDPTAWRVVERNETYYPVA